MKSENWIDVNDGKMGSAEYFGLLVKDFPMIRKKIEKENSDKTHIRMKCFADYTSEQIKSSNYKELKKCFAFQESKIDLINSDLENAIIVSYCESMLLGDVANQMDKIIDLMPNKLKKKYVDYEVYYNLSANFS